jgi:hypothetical protein
MSLWPKGEEEQMVQDMSWQWQNLTTAEVYQNWTIPFISIRWRGGVYNDTGFYTKMK